MYSSAGVFTVTLTVTDSDRAADADTMTVTVGGGLLVSQYGAGYQYGYGSSAWINMTAALDAAFNNAVTVVPNLEDLNMLLVRILFNTDFLFVPEAPVGRDIFFRR